MRKNDPLTIYPDSEVRRAVQRIAENDNDRPVSRMIEMAAKAFVVLYDRDKYAALRLVDEFSTAQK
jgi:predicted transcriptional regulator